MGFPRAGRLPVRGGALQYTRWGAQQARILERPLRLEARACAVPGPVRRSLAMCCRALGDDRKMYSD